MTDFLLGVFTGVCFVIGAQALLWEDPAPRNEAEAASDEEESDGAPVSKHRTRLRLVSNVKAERREQTLYPANSRRTAPLKSFASRPAGGHSPPGN